MLDGLLGRGFSSKCKSLIKLIKVRIDVIRRKKNATQKFLKKDIADLLANGLDINAYGRAEGLLAEMVLLACYDFIEQFCGCISKQLPIMQKQRECPEECREAVTSLMFAAARFADLPELRNLRHIFTERYENSLESFVNQEFVEKLAPKPPTTDKKIQLLRDIAQEFSIRWDSKAFERIISNPPASVLDQPKKNRSFHDTNDDGFKSHFKEDAVPKREKQDASSQRRWEVTDNGYKQSNGSENTALKGDNQDFPFHGRQELANDGYKSHFKEDAVSKREKQVVSSLGRQEITDHGYKQHNGRENTASKSDNRDHLFHGRQELANGGYKSQFKEEGWSQGAVPKREKQVVSSQGRQEIADYGYKQQNGRVNTASKSDNLDLLSHRRQELANDGYKPHNSRQDMFLNRDIKDALPRGRWELSDDGHNLCNGREDTVSKRENLDGSSHKRWEQIDNGYKPHKSREATAPKRDDQDILSHGRLECAPSYTRHQPKIDSKDTSIVGYNPNCSHNHASSVEKVFQEEAEIVKPFYNNVIPPPYVKPRSSKYGTNLEALHASSDCNEAPIDKAPNGNSANNRSESIQLGSELVPFERPVIEDANVNSHADDEDYNHQVELKRKSRSVRRRHLRPPSGHAKINNFEGDVIVKSKSNGRRRDARKGLQILFDDDHKHRDEEEKMMDRLLIHYSKKPSTYEPRMKAPPPSHHVVADTDESLQHRSRDGAQLNMKVSHSPCRALSLPPEPKTPTEAARQPVRSMSFKPELLNPAGHVHPKLPDYDDLAARFAALRGR